MIEAMLTEKEPADLLRNNLLSLRHYSAWKYHYDILCSLTVSFWSLELSRVYWEIIIYAKPIEKSFVKMRFSNENDQSQWYNDIYIFSAKTEGLLKIMSSFILWPWAGLEKIKKIQL